MRTRVSYLAENVSRMSDRDIESLPRSALLHFLSQLDPNGVWTDLECMQEGVPFTTLEDARAALIRIRDEAQK